MKTIIGSNNKDIIRIVKDALYELHLDVEVEGRKVDSGITDQPLDKETTKAGAMNRAKNAKKQVPDVDFWRKWNKKVNLSADELSEEELLEIIKKYI